MERNEIGRTYYALISLYFYSWGVNNAADLILTRWRRTKHGDTIMERDGKKVLEYVAIKRRDGTWAIPGGFRELGDKDITATQIREFTEETLNSKSIFFLQDEKKVLEKPYARFPRIYSHDPRNTDNAWVETTAVLYHDTSGLLTKNIKFVAGDDANHVEWACLHRGIKLFASHNLLLEMVANELDAYYG